LQAACSLLTTLLKGSTWDASDSSPPPDSKEAVQDGLACDIDVLTFTAIVKAACGVVEADTDRVKACHSAYSPGGLQGGVPFSRTRGGNSKAATDPEGAAAVLPWLVLLGRCCLQVGCYLQAAIAHAAAECAADPGSESGGSRVRASLDCMDSFYSAAAQVCSSCCNHKGVAYCRNPHCTGGCTWL
jgi:hypothetical protein